MVVADARQPESLRSVTDGVAAVAAVTGTTAFPSKRCGHASTVHVPMQGPAVYHWSGVVCKPLRSFIMQTELDSVSASHCSLTSGDRSAMCAGGQATTGRSRRTMWR